MASNNVKFVAGARSDDARDPAPDSSIPMEEEVAAPEVPGVPMDLEDTNNNVESATRAFLQDTTRSMAALANNLAQSSPANLGIDLAPMETDNNNLEAYSRAFYQDHANAVAVVRGIVGNIIDDVATVMRLHATMLQLQRRILLGPLPLPFPALPLVNDRYRSKNEAAQIIMDTKVEARDVIEHRGAFTDREAWDDMLAELLNPEEGEDVVWTTKGNANELLKEVRRMFVCIRVIKFELPKVHQPPPNWAHGRAHSRKRPGRK